MLNKDMQHRILKKENEVRRKLRRKGIKLTSPNQIANETPGNISREYNLCEHGILRRKISSKTDIDFKDLPF